MVLITAALVIATPTLSRATTHGLNGVIAGVGSLDPGYVDIVLLDTKTGPYANLLHAGPEEGAPSWSPTGDKIVVSSGGDLVTVNADGSGQQTLVSGGCGVSTPSWSPDGTQIAYRGGCSSALWIIDADGSNAVQVPGGAGFAPEDWSPDGQWIAGTMASGANTDIWVIHPNGDGLTQLTNLPGRQTAPSWSPDGSEIAFEDDRGTDSDITVVGASGGATTAITSGGGNDFSPSWSPDGTRIAFASNRSGGGIFTVAADGTDILHVPHSAGMGLPAWQPAQVTVTPSSGVVVSGRVVGLDIRIASTGTTNSSVLVQRRTRSTPWSDLDTVDVNAMGEASLSSKITEHTWFRAVWGGDATYAGGTSIEVEVQATVVVTGHLFRAYKTRGPWHLYHEGKAAWYTGALEPKGAGPKLCFELNVWRNGSWHRAGRYPCFPVRAKGTTTVYVSGVPKGTRMRIRAMLYDRPTLLGDGAPWERFMVTA